MMHPRRRSPCGERGLKYDVSVDNVGIKCRSPCGERGLKSYAYGDANWKDKSLPVRGAWIEMGGKLALAKDGAGRSPCGERGLKWLYGG